MLNIKPHLARYPHFIPGKILRFASLLFLLCFFSSTKFLFSQGSTTTHAEGDAAITKALKDFDSKLTCNYGLSIYDVQKGQWLYRLHDEEYFIPASNTKILTLYAALHTLKAQLDAAYVSVR